MKNLGSINDGKSIVTKEYADDTYAKKSEIASLTSKVEDVNSALGSKLDGSGFGYGVCSTDASTVDKEVVLEGYDLVKSGTVSVRFTYAVPASATLNINNKGAKSIYRRGAGITGGIINEGDTATFLYDGTVYHLISVDSNNTGGGVEVSVSGTKLVL